MPIVIVREQSPSADNEDQFILNCRLGSSSGSKLDLSISEELAVGQPGAILINDEQILDLAKV